MARRPVPVLIEQYAQRLGLDPRAIKAVAMGEGGLRWGAVGDGGHAFGPFQMNDAGGVLTGRAGSHAGYANSEAGVLDAMTNMSRYAKGLTGADAIRAVVNQYERPANKALSIQNAIARLGKIGSPNAKPTGTAKFGASVPSDSNAGSADNRTALLGYLMQSNDAFVNDSTPPSIASLFEGMRAQDADAVSPMLIGGSAGGVLPSPSQVEKGLKGGSAGVIQAIKQAQRMGLRVSENPYVDKVDPVHVQGSDHYRTYEGTNVGHAIDVGGDPNKISTFFKWIEANRNPLGLDDAFYTPMGYSYDEGGKTNYLQPKHKDHGHFSFR